MKCMKMINLALTTFILFTFSPGYYAQGPLVPATLRYQFEASSADGCGIGGIRFNGFQTNGNNWSVYGSVGNYSSSPDGFLAFSWHLNDEIGELASGSYDSRTGASTGGTHGASFDFTISRTPAGEMSFTASGEERVLSSSGSCGQSFFASTFTTAGSGGRFFLYFSNSMAPVVIQSKQSGLVLQIAGSSSADFEPVTLGTYQGTANQQWTPSGGGSFPGYLYSNTATGKTLHFDPQSGNSLVFQLTGSNRGWRFLAVGDGSYYIVTDEYIEGTTQPPLYRHLALKPVGDSSSPGAQVEATDRTNQLSQQWWVLRPQ